MVAAALTLTLLALAALHGYWALAGTSGLSVIPEVGGKPAFRPSAAGTWMVAAALSAAALLVSQRAGIGPVVLPARAAQWGTWLVAAAFLGRAFGDFRLVGFTKRVRGTRFADLDTRFLSPFCVVVGLASAAVAYAGA